MSFISVTHTEFETTASKIDEYLTYLTQEMQKADGIVEMLYKTYWNGQDSAFFRMQWNEVMNQKSTYGKTKEVLEAYAKTLRSVGAKYKKAQAAAIDRSLTLPGR